MDLGVFGVDTHRNTITRRQTLTHYTNSCLTCDFVETQKPTHPSFFCCCVRKFSANKTKPPIYVTSFQFSHPLQIACPGREGEWKKVIDGEMAGQVVRVKTELLEACMKCPLCKKLLREATTISLCLHTFCRKCIYEKLSDEEVDYCPVCKIDLGCLPVEKLRADHKLQDIRAKIFPLKKGEAKAPEVTPSVALPTKRKERSLSSLVVSTPKVPIQIGLTGRRSKSGARKGAALRGCSFSAEEVNKKEDSAEDRPTSSASPESTNRIGQNKRQDSSTAELSSEQRPNEDGEDDTELTEGKADLWTPLNCLVEAANRTKCSKSNLQGTSLAKSTHVNAPDCESHSAGTKSRAESNGHESVAYMPKANNKGQGQDTNVQDDKNGKHSLPTPLRRRRLTAARKRAAMSEELSASAQAMVDAGGDKGNERNFPLWFSLVASEDQKGKDSLPQISKAYLRIKDSKMTVSYIQKYLQMKLDLASEAEVEILCQGEPVVPTLQLEDLVDLWCRTAPTTKKVAACVGSSAKEFVMVLKYCRKAQLPS